MMLEALEHGHILKSALDGMQAERCGYVVAVSSRGPVDMLQARMLLLMESVGLILNDIARTESSRCWKRMHWARPVEVPWDMIVSRSEMAMQVP